MKCTYTFNGKTFESYVELFNYLENNLNPEDLKDIPNIVYSKFPKMDEQVERIKTLFLPKLEWSNVIESVENGEPQFRDALGILDFLDSDLATLADGSRMVTPLNTEDYIQNEADLLIKKGIYTEAQREEAIKHVKLIVDNWKIIQEDAIQLHSVVGDKNIPGGDSAEFAHSNKFSGRLDKLALKESLFNNLKFLWIKEKGKYSGSTAFKNINLKAKLKNLPKDLVAHIDWMFVGNDGKVHVYLFKTSTTSSYEWSQAKRDKYMQQISFIKKMLEQNGINVDLSTFHIVPILLLYNNNFTAINNIKVHDAEIWSSTIRGTYALTKYDRNTEYFIESAPVVSNISNSVVSRATDICNTIFQEVNLVEDGARKSAKLWIKLAPTIDPTGTEPLVITEVGEPDHAYDVKIKGKVYKIKSPRPKENNKEIEDLVSKYIETLNTSDSMSYLTSTLIDAIKDSYNKGFPTFSQFRGLGSLAPNLNTILGKYFVKTGEKGYERYEWTLMDNLIDANVLIFRNKQGVYDFISLSAFDLYESAQFRKGENLMGTYKYDSEYVDLHGNYGNIMLTRAMVLINELLPALGKVTLGNVGVLSVINGASYMEHNIGEFNKNYFLNIVKIATTENKGLEINNNFKNITFADPVEILLKEYLDIIEGKSSAELSIYEGLGFGALDPEVIENEAIDVQAELIRRLEKVMTNILTQYSSLADPEQLEKALNGPKRDALRNIAVLYKLCCNAYLSLTGLNPVYTQLLSSLDRQLYTAATVDSLNIKYVVNNLQVTHDTIASEFLEEFSPIRKFIDKFYEQAGYTNFENMTLGDQVRVFKNLFEVDEQGNNLMIFKNPYSHVGDTYYLKDYEREFLKKVLYQIAFINHNGNFPTIDSQQFNEYVRSHEDYFWVPLERASKATQRQSAAGIVNGMKNFWKKITNLGESFDEFVAGVTSYERELLGKDDLDFYSLHLVNPFSLSVITTGKSKKEVMKQRAKMLQEHGLPYFETNVENILIDFLAKHISTTLFNKFLIASKALLIKMHFTGDYSGNKEVFDKEVEYITDYLKVNVFNTSVMDPMEKKIVGVISPVKRAVTNILLGGNFISALRDTFEGALQNFLRSLLKLNTDIDPANIRDAYAYVMTHSTSDAMAMNLLSKLCLKYRLSNMDVGRIAERAKSGRNGIFNYDNWMYSTLRGPDFLNRMTLFVAKCKHDGVFGAFSLNDDGDLVYNWKEDERFKAYAENSTDTIAYNKAKSLYFSKIREWNLTHPKQLLNYTDDLPSPYSDQEIVSIRAVGDSIYGSYDKSKKAMAENQALGVLFGMFTTWMNGIVNVYLMKPQKSSVNRLHRIQETNDYGEPLYFDKNGNILTLAEGGDENLPVWKDVPTIVQGVLYTVGTIAKVFRNDGLQGIKDYLKANPLERANLHKLLSDALLWAFFAALFGWLRKEYKEHKKNAADNPILYNLGVEVLYKASSRSYDQYKGPINILTFFGNNMNPPYWQLPTKVIGDAWSFVIGDKSWKYLVFDNTGFTRSFKDTAFAYIKSQL